VLSEVIVAVVISGTVLISVDVVVIVSVSTGSVVVVLDVTVVETMIVEVAGVVVRDGVDVVTFKAYQGMVRTLDAVFTDAEDLLPCFVMQVTNDLVLTCAEAVPSINSADKTGLKSMMY
jgi:hypothetical protein